MEMNFWRKSDLISKEIFYKYYIKNQNNNKKFCIRLYTTYNKNN